MVSARVAHLNRVTYGVGAALVVVAIRDNDFQGFAHQALHRVGHIQELIAAGSVDGVIERRAAARPKLGVTPACNLVLVVGIRLSNIRSSRRSP